MKLAPLRCPVSRAAVTLLAGGFVQIGHSDVDGWRGDWENELVHPGYSSGGCHERS